MPAAIASTATATGLTNSSVITIDAPSGIAEGDSLVMIGAAGTTSTLTPPAGWNERFSYSIAGAGSLNDTYAKVWEKIATFADESASDYTITTGTSDAIGGVIFRITGWSTGNPFYAEANVTDDNVNSSGTTSATGLTLERPTEQILIMFAAGCGLTQTDSISFASQQITSSDSNPTWTELVDDTTSDLNSNSDSGWLGIAYATTTDTSDITAFQYAHTTSSDFSTVSGLLVIASPQSETGTFTHLTTTEAFTAPLVSVGVTGTHVNLEAGIQHNTPSASGGKKSWHQEDVSDTAWNKPTI